MLPTFVIGLREGLEAALIVGIIAAFLRKQGRLDLLRQVWLGVGAAVLLCVAVGVGLDLYSHSLPQRQQEGLETVIGVLAVGMVTYMVVWMKEHARGLRSELETLAAGALGQGSAADGTRTGRFHRAGTAMVAMAFLAVLREGFETAVFLLAAFNGAGSGLTPLIGVLLGIAVAVGLGYGIYRGGVHINLSRFFRATGLVLVLVAAGLVVSALHTAHEAGWIDVGQQRLLDLSWLVQPGSVMSSLLTGMLGLQPYPVLIEVLGWLLYTVPVGIFVAWPPGRTVPWRRLGAGMVAGGTVALGVAALLMTTLPSTGAAATASLPRLLGDAGPIGTADTVTVLAPVVDPLTGADRRLRASLTRASASTLAGRTVAVFSGETTTDTRATRLGAARIADLNGGRLPIGVRPSPDPIPVDQVDVLRTTATVDTVTGTVLDLVVVGERRLRVATAAGGTATVPDPARTATWRLPEADVSAAADQARAAQDAQEVRVRRGARAWLLAGLGLPALLGGAVVLLRRRSTAQRAMTAPATGSVPEAATEQTSAPRTVDPPKSAPVTRLGTGPPVDH